MRLRIMILVWVAVLGISLANTSAQEPGWSGQVIARGETRAQIEATPILQRPYRPLHVYGNTVRRRHYHGTALPQPRGSSQAVASSARRG